MEVAILNIAS